MDILSQNTLAQFNLALLHGEVRAVFGDRFIDFNQTASGAQLTVYLTAAQGGDVVLLAQVLTAHNPLARTPEQQAEQRRVQAAAEYKLLTALQGMTAVDAEAWIEANVTSLATAKTAMKVMAKAIVLLARTSAIED